jgi:hypothetical protein
MGAVLKMKKIDTAIAADLSLTPSHSRTTAGRSLGRDAEH